MAWRLKRFKWESRDMVLKQMEGIEGVRYAKRIIERREKALRVWEKGSRSRDKLTREGV